MKKMQFADELFDAFALKMNLSFEFYWSPWRGIYLIINHFDTKPLLETIMTQFIDVYMRRQISMS